MKTIFQTDSRTIFLEGDIEKPTEEDMVQVQQIRDELAAKHEGEGGKIIHQSSKGSGYRQLTIEWRSKPKLEN
ncbi:hypothetical protein ES708_32800 [subsurface metagenome]